MKKKKTFVGKMIQVVLRIPVEADSKIREIAGKECRSYSSVLRQAISDWLASRRTRSAPPVRSDEELFGYSAEHVYYEVQRFFWTARLLGQGETFFGSTEPGDNVILNHGLIEVFVLHLRNIIAFLFSTNPWETDIVANQFLPPGDWAKCRGKMSSTLDRAKRRADKEMAHLTTDRIAGSPPQKAWDFKGLAGEIRDLIKLLSEKAIPTRLSPNVVQAIGEGREDKNRSISIFQTFGPEASPAPGAPTKGMTGPSEPKGRKS